MTFFQLVADPQYKHKYVLEKIIGHLTGWTREELILHYDDVVNQELLEQFKIQYNRYVVDQEPLEYILWYVEYGGLRFSVTKDTLIPRPETEYMIESVREHLGSSKLVEGEQFKTQNSKLITLVDVGTWSGVLGLSVLYSHGSQIVQAFLLDISKGALEVAKDNYAGLVSEKKITSDIVVVIEEGNLFDTQWIDTAVNTVEDMVITANLPYIPDEDFDTNPDKTIKHEPRVAFVWGNDGLDLYRIMFEQIKNYHWKVKNEITMFLEMMTWQVDILRQEFEWLEFEEIKTFHFNIRIVKAVFKS